ncbi:MAG TPA: Hpt domain-containing protein [Candidatus Aquilonibacter sp.]|nr:Hpt domain-containing protein [Candidatus Aquilonibacter sp.]
MSILSGPDESIESKAASNGKLDGGPPDETPELILDIAGALVRVEGDRDLLANLLGIFLEESQRAMTEVRRGFDLRNASLTGRFAHTIHGSAANVGANAVAKTAGALEKKMHGGDWESSDGLVAALDRDITRFIAAATLFLAGEHASRRSRNGSQNQPRAFD